MPDKVKLSQNEKVLCFFATTVVISSIGLALCIGLVLPRHWTTEGYIGNSRGKTAEELWAECHCGRKRYTTNHMDCIPHGFPNRVVTITSDKPGALCELIQNYPYLVSLHVPAYYDDKKEKRFACSGTILTKVWVLVGEDCVQDKDELKLAQIRAGSTYWSKGGTEHSLMASSKFHDNGPTALKVEPPFEFSKYIKAVRLPRKGVYTTWISASSVGWRKNNRKYDTFVVERWTTTPCADGCQTGKVSVEPSCGKKITGTSLVDERRLLIGFLGGICNDGSRYEHSYVDLQTEEYEGWFDYLAGRPEKAKITALQPMERELDNVTPEPLKIYELKDCAVVDPDSTQSPDHTKKELTQDSSATEIQTTTISGKPNANTQITNSVSESKSSASQAPTTSSPETSSITSSYTQETTRSLSTMFPFDIDIPTPLYRNLVNKVPSSGVKNGQVKGNKAKFRIYPEIKPDKGEDVNEGNPAEPGADVTGEYGDDDHNKVGKVIQQRLTIPLTTTMENVGYSGYDETADVSDQHLVVSTTDGVSNSIN